MSYLTGDPLEVRVRIAFGAAIAADPATWTWTDVTEWWHISEDVAISWGRSQGADQPETSTLALTLKNTDGRFTSGHPMSPYWPNVRKWTPISVDIDLGDGVAWRNRFSGYIRRWPLTWPGRSAEMALARIEAVGILGRINRGSPPARSPMFRTFSATGPVAYWPAEDGVLSQQAAAAIAGQGPLRVSGIVEFKRVPDYSYEGITVTRYGTAALADLSGGGQLAAALPAAAVTATAAGAWTVHAAIRADYSTLPSDTVLMEWTCDSGTYRRWQLKMTTLSRTQVIGYNVAGAPTTLIDYGSTTSTFVSYGVSASVSAGTVTVRLDGGPATNLPGSTTFSGQLGGVLSVAVNPASATATAELLAGHVAVWARAPLPVEAVPTSSVDAAGVFVREARRSFQNESAGDRLRRLAAEDGVPLTMPTVPLWSYQRMGWQPQSTPMPLYEECEAADGGLLYESGFGLAYLPRAARYNAPVTLTIDADARQLAGAFEPTDDDQLLRNSWTVERTEGSSATADDPASIAVQGRIEASANLNLASDAPLADQAGWRLRQSTVAEPRYPSVGINLGSSRELAAAWVACRPGSRIQVVNPPPQAVPGVIDQLVVGASETFRGRQSWRASMSVVPAAPWQVATAGGARRAATDGSTLAADTDLAGATVVSAGFAATAASSWPTADVGGSWTVEGTASDYSASGGVGRMALGTVLVSRRAIVGTSRADADMVATITAPLAVDGDIQPMLGLRWTDNNNTYLYVVELRPDQSIWAGIEKRVAGVQSTIGKTQTALAPGAALRMRARARGTLLAMRVWLATDPEPTTWDCTGTDSALTAGRQACRAILGTGNTNVAPVVTWDDVRVFDPTTLSLASTAGLWTTKASAMPLDLAVGGERVTVSAIAGSSSPQTATVSARAVNGVERSWPAGTPVQVWQPAVAPL
ncbi:hypothetical protein [Micromonospora sp. HUAS LYJ1]|uniref:hypothetical protein n=1 Tax=Micromonospora sp. HUAS LYJ1 TaxID=3061626 RepID=UPI00267385A4|nr:hypothetical protein [Micromonospora sp. HUAS LYJ1]WKU08016.1 hypothetical protein Q2K16_13790 [Micromonospora sp. HUAS LYJ1]